MQVNSGEDLVRSTAAAWDRAARKYAGEVESDVAFLRAGHVSLERHERRILGDLSGCQLAVHLQCSHGLDALSLLNLGASEVIGIDLSREMLALAAQKSQMLGARARWVHADVLNIPAEFDRTADLVYTGKGALPWVADLGRWAGGVARLLRHGGRLYIYEGHPLTWMWDVTAGTHRLSGDGRSYFDRMPRANQDFPAAAVELYTPTGEQAPQAWEYQWTLGEIVTSLCDAGLHIERLEEHAEQFWPKFRKIPDAELQRLPHSFSVLARSPAA
jgi:SAM-dependent methyltransferase